MHFVAITSFRNRNGRTKDRVAIIDGPDPRCARLLYRTRIRNTWWTHNHWTYPGGSVIFENGVRLCMATMSIKGRPVFVFEDNEFIEIMWRRQALRDRSLAWMKDASAADLLVAAQLLSEKAGLKPAMSIYWRPRLEEVMFASMEGVGLPDLEAFVSLVNIPPPAQAASPAA